MINREIIRIKIVQLTYAYYQNGNKNIDSAEKEPSQKFVFNRFALQLEENKALADFISTQKFTWEDAAATIGQLFEAIESSDIYKEYMESKEDNYETDRELWRKLYKTFFMENADLDAILEDQSLYWNDDKEIVDTFVLKTIKRFKEQNGAKEELLPEWDSEEEKEYARKLFRAAILNDAQYQRFMSEASRNWDFSRLAYMDVIIMQWISPSSTLPVRAAVTSTACSTPLPVTSSRQVDCSSTSSPRRRSRRSRKPRNPNVNALKSKN